MVYSTNNAGFVERKLESLREEHATATDLLAKSRLAVETGEVAVMKLSAQISVLEDLLTEIGLGSTNGHAADQRVLHFRLKPTEAVLRLLREKCMTMPEIIDELEDKVDTSAKNVRHNIRTTLYNLKTAGKIEKHDEGYKIVDPDE